MAGTVDDANSYDAAEETEDAEGNSRVVALLLT
jgi:hypothetical protein